jgi:hypothetical protein
MTKRIVAVAAVAGLVAAGVLPAAAAGPAVAEVRTFPGPGTVIEGGQATLVRQPHGISFTFKAVELEPGHVHTIWFVAFNNPEACTSPMMDGATKIAECGLPDLAVAAVQATAVWGAGNVVGGSGVSTLGGRVRVGDTSGCDHRLPCNEGLTDPEGAEIHLVLRTHKEMIPHLVSKQMHSFNRGCEVGEPNVGCANIQFAAFQP